MGGKKKERSNNGHGLVHAGCHFSPPQPPGVHTEAAAYRQAGRAWREAGRAGRVVSKGQAGPSAPTSKISPMDRAR